jgi:hypothetical protein
MSELKPCPFCGNDKAMSVGRSNDVYHEEDCECRGDNDNWHAVFCDAASKHRGCGAACGFQPTRTAAIEAWNRRESQTENKGNE